MPDKQPEGSGPIAELKLSTLEQKVLLAAYKCNKSGGPQIDYSLLATELDFIKADGAPDTVKSRNAWFRVKRKAFPEGLPDAKVTAGAATPGKETAAKFKTPKKPVGKGKQKVDSVEEDYEANDSGIVSGNDDVLNDSIGNSTSEALQESMTFLNRMSAGSMTPTPTSPKTMKKGQQAANGNANTLVDIASNVPLPATPGSNNTAGQATKRKAAKATTDPFLDSAIDGGEPSAKKARKDSKMMQNEEVEPIAETPKKRSRPISEASAKKKAESEAAKAVKAAEREEAKAKKEEARLAQQAARDQKAQEVAEKKAAADKIKAERAVAKKAKEDAKAARAQARADQAQAKLDKKAAIALRKKQREERKFGGKIAPQAGSSTPASTPAAADDQNDDTDEVEDEASSPVEPETEDESEPADEQDAATDGDVDMEKEIIDATPECQVSTSPESQIERRIALEKIASDAVEVANKDAEIAAEIAVETSAENSIDNQASLDADITKALLAERVQSPEAA